MTAAFSMELNVYVCFGYWGCYDMGNPSLQSHLKLKSRGISSTHDRFAILHRVRQWYCRALCKISKRLDYSIGRYRQRRIREPGFKMTFGGGGGGGGGVIYFTSATYGYTHLSLIRFPVKNSGSRHPVHSEIGRFTEKKIPFLERPLR